MPPDLIVDAPDEVIAALEKRAAANGRSLEDEHRAILEGAFGRPDSFNDEHRARWSEHAESVRKMTDGRFLTPSEELVRDAREGL